MPIKENIRCAIVMAGGDGERLRPFVRELRQSALPKQYVNVIGRRSMLEHTIDRAQRIIPLKQIVAVVSESHLEFSEARQQLTALPRESVVIQPLNRGTWPGILLPLARVYERYPEATVVLFPSDHFVLQEDLFLAHVMLAMQRVEEQQPERMVLLGAPADRPDPEFGYIVTRALRRAAPLANLSPLKEFCAARGGLGLEFGQIGALLRRGSFASDFLTIKEFIEKPALEQARELVSKNALWNTGILVAKATALVRYTRELAPDLYREFLRMKKLVGSAAGKSELKRLYQGMRQRDLSRDFLAALPHRYPLCLLALPLEQVLWSDWGSKERLLAALDVTGYRMRLRRGAHAAPGRNLTLARDRFGRADSRPDAGEASDRPLAPEGAASAAVGEFTHQQVRTQ
ncbi:MAG TPA: sugar phosphate nucleotidyltransferase [Candidatus Eisenbacteria bacterium]|nr:sugar phosphate nucleotidyltransferase [Candidatus Eisenbacteria bacterium]